MDLAAMTLAELEAASEALEARRLALRAEARAVADELAKRRRAAQVAARVGLHRLRPGDAEALKAIVRAPGPVEVGVRPAAI